MGSQSVACEPPSASDRLSSCTEQSLPPPPPPTPTPTPTDPLISMDHQATSRMTGSNVRRAARQPRRSSLWYYLQTPLGIILLILLAIYLLWYAYWHAANVGCRFVVVEYVKVASRNEYNSNRSKVRVKHVKTFTERQEDELRQIKGFTQRYPSLASMATQGSLLPVKTYYGSLSKLAAQSCQGYTHSVHIVQMPSEQSKTLQLRIEETVAGSSTEGGSNFRMIIAGRYSLDSCTIWDEFNGNYSCACPVHEEFVSVTTRLMFTNFNAFKYQGHMPPLNKEVALQDDIHISDVQSSNRTKIQLIACRPPPPEVFSYPVSGTFWARRDTKWLLVWEGHCIVPLPSIEHAAQHLEKYSSLHFFGDKPITSAYTYVKDISSKSTWRKYMFGGNKKIDHQPSTRISDLVSTFVNTLKKYSGRRGGSERRNHSNTEKDLFLFGAGSLDLQRDNTSVVLSNMDALFSVVRLFLQERSSHQPRMVWLSILPRSRYQQDGGNVHYTSALNAWINRGMRRLGVEVIDLSRMMYPVVGLHTGHDGYDCVKDECKKHIDSVVLGAILHVLCK